jgi:hypothetical protein
MLFDIQVRPGRNSGYFQYYTETVEAATSHDAVAKVQRANPGCQVVCTRSYNKPSGNKSSGSSDIDGGGLIGLIGLAAAAWAFVSFTPWILMILGGASATWIGEKITGQSVEEYNEREDDKGHGKAAIVLVLALIAGGFGFVKGDEIKKGFDAPSDTPAQVQSK